MTSSIAKAISIVDNALDDADLQPVIDEVDKAVDFWAKKFVEQGKLSRDYAEEPFEYRLTKICDENSDIVNHIWSGTLSGPAFSI